MLRESEINYLQSMDIKKETSLVLYNSSGEPTIIMNGGADGSGPSILLKSEKSGSIVIEISGDGCKRISISNSDNDAGAVINVSPGGCPAMEISTMSGFPAFKFGIATHTDDWYSSIQVYDDGKLVFDSKKSLILTRDQLEKL